MVNFNRNLKADIAQAITQAPANRNWQLVTWHPGLEIDLLVMDYKDYLCNDIYSQMSGNKKSLRFAMSKIERGLRMVKAGVAEIRREVK